MTLLSAIEWSAFAAAYLAAGRYYFVLVTNASANEPDDFNTAMFLRSHLPWLAYLKLMLCVAFVVCGWPLCELHCAYAQWRRQASPQSSGGD